MPDMYRGAICSGLFHLAILLLVIFGLPHFARDLPMESLPVPIDVVTIAETTNAPPPPAPKVEKPEPPKPEPPKPEQKPEAVAEAVPPTPKPKVKPEPPVKDIKPERKPPPPDDMESVLKSVEKLKPQQHEQTPVEAAEALKNQKPVPREYNPASPVTISQIDAIRRHFEKCWNIPAGARDAEDLAVDIRVSLSPDASVQRAEIVNTGRIATDPFYRAAAESALRAVLNPLCSSLQDVGLHADQYDEWKDMVITFNPKQMTGA